MSRRYQYPDKFASISLRNNSLYRHSDIDEAGIWLDMLNHIVSGNNLGEDPLIDEDGYIISTWKPSDSKLAFDNNINDPQRRRMLIKHGWIDEHTNEPIPFEYKLNRNFFRCNHFEDKPSVVSLGCSYTYGVGLPHEYIWPTLLSNHLNLESYNLGCPGRSVALSAVYFMENFERYFKNCEVVAALLPPANRVELVVNNENSESLYITSLFKQTAIDQLNGPSVAGKEIVDGVFLTSYFYDRIILRMLQELTKNNGIKLVVGRADDISDHSGSLARDLMHHGKSWQYDVYSHFRDLL